MQGFLALCCPYFARLFFGDFVEGKQEEVELIGVCHRDFISLLRVSETSPWFRKNAPLSIYVATHDR